MRDGSGEGLCGVWLRMGAPIGRDRGRRGTAGQDERRHASSERGRRVFVFAATCKTVNNQKGIRREKATKKTGTAHPTKRNRVADRPTPPHGNRPTTRGQPPKSADVKSTRSPADDPKFILFLLLHPSLPVTQPEQVSLCENQTRRESRRANIQQRKGKEDDTNLSLHPSPVVSPMPPLSSLPSRCLTLRCGVSLASLRCFEEVLVVDISERLDKLDT